MISLRGELGEVNCRGFARIFKPHERAQLVHFHLQVIVKVIVIPFLIGHIFLLSSDYHIPSKF
jgi:hypothetical protein